MLYKSNKAAIFNVLSPANCKPEFEPLDVKNEP